MRLGKVGVVFCDRVPYVVDLSHIGPLLTYSLYMHTPIQYMGTRRPYTHTVTTSTHSHVDQHTIHTGPYPIHMIGGIERSTLVYWVYVCCVYTRVLCMWYALTLYMHVCAVYVGVKHED